HHDVRVARQLLLEDLDRHGLAGLPRDGRLGTRGLPLAGSPDGARGAAAERLLEQVLAAYRPHVMRSLLLACPDRPPVLRVVRPTVGPQILAPGCRRLCVRRLSQPWVAADTPPFPGSRTRVPRVPASLPDRSMERTYARHVNVRYSVVDGKTLA